MSEQNQTWTVQCPICKRFYVSERPVYWQACGRPDCKPRGRKVITQ